MATDDPYIIAKKDKPGHCCACNCMSGKFCQRWWVLSATGIEHCGWLPLEFGVIVKFDWVLSNILSSSTWAWRFIDTPGLITYMIQRNAHPLLNNWTIFIISGGCVLRVVHEQALDEQLWQGGTDLPFVALGACAGDPPIGTLSAQMYRTQAAALEDWPDMQTWDWS